MSALEHAYDELRRRTQQADTAGDWQERCILEPLASVADHVKRIGDHRDSAHYRADKSGPLVTAALRVQREALAAYVAGQWGDDSPAADAIEATADALDDAAAAVLKALWLIAHAGPQSLPTPGLAEAAGALSAAVDRAWDFIHGEGDGS